VAILAVEALLAGTQRNSDIGWVPAEVDTETRTGSVVFESTVSAEYSLLFVRSMTFPPVIMDLAFDNPPHLMPGDTLTVSFTFEEEGAMRDLLLPTFNYEDLRDQLLALSEHLRSDESPG
jgi:hypothetical protein